MKNNAVRVTLWNREVGCLFGDASKGNSVFQFNKDFLQSGLDIAPIVAPLTSPVVQRGTLCMETSQSHTLGFPNLSQIPCPTIGEIRYFSVGWKTST